MDRCQAAKVPQAPIAVLIQLQVSCPGPGVGWGEAMGTPYSGLYL